MNKLVYVTYIWHFRGIFVSERYLAIIWEVGATVGCILLDMWENVGSLCQYGIMAVIYICNVAAIFVQ